MLGILNPIILKHQNTILPKNTLESESELTCDVNFTFSIVQIVSLASTLVLKKNPCGFLVGRQKKGMET